MSRAETRFKLDLLRGAVTSLVLLASLPASAQDSARSLVSKMIDNELKVQKQPHYWMYLDSNRSPGKAEVDRVIQLPQCWMKWPVSVNGHPPTPTEQQHARDELRKLVNDEEARRKKRQEIDSDGQKADTLMKRLPATFIFTPAGRAGKTIRFNFRPDPQFSPSSSEEKIFHNMRGVLVIDATEIRLMKLSGTLISDVDFGLGILGRIYKGGTFQVIQSEILPSCWELTQLDVHISGRAVFFHTINEQQHEVKSQFTPVPPDLPLAQAATWVETGRKTARRKK